MKIITSTVQFNGYRVIKALFTATDVMPREGDEIELDPTFTRSINKIDGDAYSLTLGVKIGSQESADKLPFIIEVTLEGAFILGGEYNADNIMKTNAVAILFPYLRATLSMLTNIANITPLVLPTVNLAQMFENEHANTHEDNDQ